MVTPPYILLERDRINDNVEEAVVKAALKFKPENTGTKVLESTNYYEIFLEALAMHSMNALLQSGEAWHKVLRITI